MPTLDQSKTAQAQKTKITHQRVEYIRNHMDTSVGELQAETGLSEYVIEITKEAYRNDFWRQHGGGDSKFDRLTDEMKDYLRDAEFDTWWDLRVMFNRRFRMSDLTPMHDATLRKYYQKLGGRKCT